MFIERQGGSARVVSELLWLDAQDKAADGDLLIGSDLDRLAAREFVAVDQRRVSPFGYYPVAAFVIK